MVIEMGNQGMITLIGVSSHLHTPMYYFLSYLYFIDLCQSTVITPKCWWTLWEKKISPTLNAWLSSIVFAEMTYEGYVAICNPLLYNAIMSYYRCFQFTAAVYILWII